MTTPATGTTESGTARPAPTAVQPAPRPFRGRLMVLAGILFLALSLRVAVSGVSPVIGQIAADVPFGVASMGVLGMLPTAAFALMGFLTPWLIRRVGLDPLLLAAITLTVAGQAGRALVSDVPLFLGFSALIMIGYGIGNIVLPPLVKRYFPDRLGLVTALYVMLLAVSTALSPQLAVPIADAAGWRWSVGIWASLCLMALVPWIVTIAGERSQRRNDGGTPAPQAGAPAARFAPWRSPVAWGLALVFAGTSTNTFSMFSWLPPLLTDAGLDTGEAGSMLGYYAILGLPTSLLVPLIVARLRNPFPLAVVFILLYAGGYLGLILSPGAGTWLWITMAGLGQGTYALALLLINLRTRTTAGAGALSGFSQGIGYGVACAGPLCFGLVHELAGTWTASFGLLGGALAILTVGAFIVSRPRFFEDKAVR
jgi:MFS transporter, CP family, cyanate transporter